MGRQARASAHSLSFDQSFDLGAIRIALANDEDNESTLTYRDALTIMKDLAKYAVLSLQQVTARTDFQGNEGWKDGRSWLTTTKTQLPYQHCSLQIQVNSPPPAAAAYPCLKCTKSGAFSTRKAERFDERCRVKDFESHGMFSSVFVAKIVLACLLPGCKGGGPSNDSNGHEAIPVVSATRGLDPSVFASLSSQPPTLFSTSSLAS